MIVGILQARTDSSRFPKKILKKIYGKSILELQIQRLLQCKNIDKLVLATTKKNQMI